MSCKGGTGDTAFLGRFCHLAIACSRSSLCTCDLAAQMSLICKPFGQLRDRAELTVLACPEHGMLSATVPRLILISAMLLFWSKGALSLAGAPWSKERSSSKEKVAGLQSLLYTNSDYLAQQVCAVILLLSVKTHHCEQISELQTWYICGDGEVILLLVLLVKPCSFCEPTPFSLADTELSWLWLSGFTWREAVVTCGTSVTTTVCFVSCNVVKHLKIPFLCEQLEVTVKLCVALTKMQTSELYCFTSIQG